MVVRFALLFALTSCQWVFPRDGAPDSGLVDGPFEPCGARPDDPLRYSPGVGGNNWATSASECRKLGMELATFDDKAEFDRFRSLAPPPYWIGVMRSAGAFTALDQCEPYIALGASEPQVTDGCVFVGSSFGMGADDCNAQAFSGTPVNWLCETPRPSAACAAVPEGPYAVGDATPQPFGKANTLCQDLVQINSSAELDAVETFAVDNGISNFWITPQYDGSKWTSVDGCPSVFRWAPNEPTVATGSCAVYVVGEGMKTRDCTQSSSVICEH